MNRQTGQYASTIKELMKFLFSTYGNITATDLDIKAEEVKKTTIDLTKPIDSMFNSIEELADYAEAADSPYTQLQLIDLGYIIIKKNPAFQHDIRQWLHRPKAEHTWQNFKVHFRVAHQELKNTQGPTVDNLGYANAIAELVIEKLQVPPQDHDYHHQEVPQEPTDHAAAIQHNPTEVKFLLQQLLTMMSNQQQQATPPSQNSNQQQNQGSNRNNQRNNRNSQRNNHTPAKKTTGKLYCWTHGACAHTSETCNKPADGHKKEATFSNMMNGSTKYRFWLPNHST